MINIYKIVNKISGKIYIGQTTKSIEVRFKKHINDAFNKKRSYAIHLALVKYGVENFEVSLLDQCSSFEESNQLEKYYIETLDTLSPKGYNLRPGGNNSPHTQSTREKISRSKTGVPHTEIHNKRISEAGKGRIGVWKGKTLPKETRQKMSKAQKGRPGTTNRKVVCIETGEIFNSIAAAAVAFKTDRSKIWEICNGRRKTIKKRRFKYFEEFMIDWTNPLEKISTHFTVKEAIWLPKWSRLANSDELADDIKQNLIDLFNKMDKIREFFKAPILVHVALRPIEYNKLIGGAQRSSHLIGKACDFHVVGNNCDFIRQAIIDNNLLETLNLRMEDNPGSNWVHLDISNPSPNRFFKP